MSLGHLAADNQSTDLYPRGMGVLQPLRSTRAQIIAMTVAMVVVAGVLWALPTARDWTPTRHDHLLQWWSLAPLFAGAQLAVLHIQIRREARTLTLSEIPMVLGLFLATPTDLIAGQLLGSLFVFLVIRRVFPLKTAWNAANLTLEAPISLTLVHTLNPSGQVGPQAWAAAVFAVVVVGVVTNALVVIVIAINEGAERLREWPSAVGQSALFSAFGGCVGLAATGLLLWNEWSSVLLLMLATGMFVFYRAYSNLSHRHVTLGRLHELSLAMAASHDIDQVVHGLLVKAKLLLHSERSFVVFLDEPTQDLSTTDVDGLLVHLDEHNDESRTSTSLDGGAGSALNRVLVDGTPLLLQRWDRALDVRALLRKYDARDAAVVPLRGRGGVLGVLGVANRLGDILTFEERDIQLLETVSGHASVALENGRLVDQLRHEAMHDSLTNLPNRGLLERRLRAAIADASDSDDSNVAILLVDLDGFKDVNDTLGHHIGDDLLREVSTRFTAVVRDSDTVARIGGDEFAVLLPSTSRERALGIAGRLLQALEQPVQVETSEVEVGASIGIALAPHHASDVPTLLRRADIAMYSAKTAIDGVRMYEPAIDTYTPTRLTRVTELRQALTDRKGIAVHFQPKVAADGGRVIGMEALARWQPAHGPAVSPDEFIPVAERTGLIRPLTTFVLRESLSACLEWRRAGHDIGVAVNLSPRSLLDADLVQEIRGLLTRYPVGWERLTVEITESSVMSDPVRAEQVLNDLRQIGVRISIDDFGTGYSSLSYLRRLPANEVKIDRHFVAGMIREPGALAIVRSIIDLGLNLGLEVVAEGVEDQASWQLLRDYRCTTLQGYAIAAAMPAAEASDWLSRRAMVTVG